MVNWDLAHGYSMPEHAVVPIYTSDLKMFSVYS